MIKRDLRALRSLYATKEMVEKAKTLKGEHSSAGYNYKTQRYESKLHTYKYAYYGRVQNLEGYVKVALYKVKDLRNDIRTPFAEVFIDPRNRDYITREWDEDGSEKWRSCKIDSIINFYRPWYSYTDFDETCWLNRDALKTIKTVLGTTKKGVEGILQFQEGVRTEKIKEKDRRTTDAWDEEMATVPEVPEDFYQWIKKDGLEKHYLFYDSDKDRGYCSRCDGYVKLKTFLPYKVFEPAHNKEGECPKCGAKVIYKHVNRMSQCLSSVQQSGLNGAELIQYDKGRIIARQFRISLRYRGKGWKSAENPIWDIHEDVRYIRGKDYLHRYFFTNWKSKGFRWAMEQDYYSPWGTGRFYYEGSRKDRKLVSKFSVVPAMFDRNRAKYNLNIFSYLTNEKTYPIYEQLYKAGCKALFRAVNRGILSEHEFDNDKTSLIGKLKLDSMRFRRLLKANGGKFYYLWLLQEKMDNTIYEDSFIEEMEKNQIFPRDFDRIPLEISCRKKYNYILRQDPKDLHGALTQWRDYLVMAEKLKMDISNGKLAMPKNLYIAHNELVNIIERGKIGDQVKGLKKKYKNLVNTIKTLTKYEYSGEKFCIVAPTKIDDIILEGISLGHCVHTCEYYWQRMDIKETYILFLRRADTPTVPWYTLEVEPSGNIRQKRTTGDKQNRDLKAANAFLKEWQKVIQKRLSKEDKVLAKKSDEKRREEYKDLRANGNRVWHGVLKGKLLADVLENDFMPVDNENEPIDNKEECLQTAAG